MLTEVLGQLEEAGGRSTCSRVGLQDHAVAHAHEGSGTLGEYAPHFHFLLAETFLNDALPSRRVDIDSGILWLSGTPKIVIEGHQLTYEPNVGVYKASLGADEVEGFGT